MADASLVLKIGFELTEKDFGFFRDRFEDAVKSVADRDEASIIAAAKGVVSAALSSSPPDFVRAGVAKLERFVAMLEDAEWKLEGSHRTRVLSALAYFADANDLIADATPGVGYVDDAIMIELVARDLADDLQNYEEFLTRRAGGSDTPEHVAQLREELHAKLALRYAAMERRLSSTRSPFRLLY